MDRIDINDKIEEWHRSGFAEDQLNPTLYEFLGMTREEYAEFVTTSKLSEEMKKKYYE